jgi:hypothetical protein
MRSELHYNDGPCVQELDRTLKQIGVERQAYFGGTFVGNHVNKCLKEENTKLLCSKFTDAVPPAIYIEAKEIGEHYEGMFALFANCYNVYSVSRKVSLSEVDDLGEFHALNT